MKIVFLCSGGGGNLKFLNEAIRKSKIDLSIAKVFADRECDALRYAEKEGIQNSIADFTAEGQDEFGEKLESIRPDLVITNIHRIVEQKVLARFPNKFINLHYSILPSFGGSIGTKPVVSAINFGSKLLGATVHHVSSELDAGTPIVQVAFPLRNKEKFNSELMDVIFRCGCLSLFSAIELELGSIQAGPGVINIMKRECLFSALSEGANHVNNETVWEKVKAL